MQTLKDLKKFIYELAVITLLLVWFSYLLDIVYLLFASIPFALLVIYNTITYVRAKNNFK